MIVQSHDEASTIFPLRLLFLLAVSSFFKNGFKIAFFVKQKLAMQIMCL